MAGLLGDFGDFLKTPEGQGLLSGVMGYAANARQGTPWNNLGRGGLAGIMGYSGALDRQAQAAEAEQMKKYRDAQLARYQYEIDAAKKAEADKKTISGIYAKNYQPAQQVGGFAPKTDSMGLPIFDGSSTFTPMSTTPAKFNAEAAAGDLFKAGFADQGFNVLEKFKPKEEEPYTLSEGQVRMKGGKVVASAPAKQANLPSAVQEYQFAVGQGYKGSFEQWQNAANAAKAPKMSVDMRDPTAVAKAAMDFQDKYRAATKPSFQRAQAYESMMTAAQDPSPKGDLTMVYSFIKALDPESVVREGEIDLVNANRSIPDRVKGYAQRLATGQSLLPAERQDLINQARTLMMTDYKRSRGDISAYRDNAKRLQLDPDMYAPDPYQNFDPMGVRDRKKPQSILNVPQMNPADPLGLFR